MPRKRALQSKSTKEDFQTALGFKFDYTFEALWVALPVHLHRLAQVLITIQQYIKTSVKHNPWHLMTLEQRNSLMASIAQFCSGKEELDELLLNPHTGKLKDAVRNTIELLIRKASKATSMSRAGMYRATILMLVQMRIDMKRNHGLTRARSRRKPRPRARVPLARFMILPEGAHHQRNPWNDGQKPFGLVDFISVSSRTEGKEFVRSWFSLLYIFVRRQSS